MPRYFSLIIPRNIRIRDINKPFFIINSESRSAKCCGAALLFTHDVRYSGKPCFRMRKAVFCRLKGHLSHPERYHHGSQRVTARVIKNCQLTIF